MHALLHNGTPSKFYPHLDSIRRPVVTHEPDAMSDGATSPHSPQAIHPRILQVALSYFPASSRFTSSSIMQEPTQTKIATLSRKGKERESAQPDIADRIIALRRKQAYVLFFSLPQSTLSRPPSRPSVPPHHLASGQSTPHNPRHLPRDHQLRAPPPRANYMHPPSLIPILLCPNPRHLRWRPTRTTSLVD